MRRRLKNSALHAFGLFGRMAFVVILVALIAGACDTRQTAHSDTYTCPMHPTVISDRPGTCPVCAMDLVRKARPGEEVEITQDLARLLRSPNQSVVSSSMKTIRGQYRSVPVSIPAHGVVMYDARRIYTVPARVGGRLEKVYLQYEGQPVRKGQRIAEVYSPELVAAQRELLFVLEADSENHAIITQAERKLALLGMTPSQIRELRNRREATYTFTIYSPHDGYLTTQPVSGGSVSPAPDAMGGGAMGSGMSSSTTQVQPTQSGASQLLRSGDYVSAGQTLFTLVDATALRVELNVSGAWGGLVKEGTPVKLEMENQQPQSGTVDLVQPFFDRGESFIKIRVYLKNSERLPIGQLVNAEIFLDAVEALWVPREAVLDLGLREVVFVKDRDVFQPREVSTGIRSNEMVAIRTGLASVDEIAANAQFMVDSEGFIKPVN